MCTNDVSQLALCVYLEEKYEDNEVSIQCDLCLLAHAVTGSAVDESIRINRSFVRSFARAPTLAHSLRLEILVHQNLFFLVKSKGKV